MVLPLCVRAGGRKGVQHSRSSHIQVIGALGLLQLGVTHTTALCRKAGMSAALVPQNGQRSGNTTQRLFGHRPQDTGHLLSDECSSELRRGYAGRHAAVL